MSERRNLWIGLLLGILLTGLLMFALHQQAGIVQMESQPAKDGAGPQTINSQTPAESPWVKAKVPSSPAKPVNADPGNRPDNGVVSKDPSQSPAQIITNTVVEPVADGELKIEEKQAGVELVLPEGLNLSPAELQGLSDAEQLEYQALLASYREVRAQVLRLHQERAQLNQRMDTIFERNEVMEQELDKMREAVQLQTQNKPLK